MKSYRIVNKGIAATVQAENIYAALGKYASNRGFSVLEFADNTAKVFDGRRKWTISAEEV